MRKSLFLSVCLALLAGLAAPVMAEIYKSVDENGNVLYSDQPSPGAERIKKREVPTIPSDMPKTEFGSSNNAGQENGEASTYRNIQIVTPENDTAVRANAGNLSVSVALQPALLKGHEIVLYMDGQPAAQSRSPVFQFSNIDRGTHTLAAAVVDGRGNELIRSDGISFTMQRKSKLQPNADIPGSVDAPSPSGPTPTNPPSGQPSGQNPVSPTFPGPTPTNPPKPSP